LRYNWDEHRGCSPVPHERPGWGTWVRRARTLLVSAPRVKLGKDGHGGWWPGAGRASCSTPGTASAGTREKGYRHGNATRGAGTATRTLWIGSRGQNVYPGHRRGDLSDPRLFDRTGRPAPY